MIARRYLFIFTAIYLFLQLIVDIENYLFMLMAVYYWGGSMCSIFLLSGKTTEAGITLQRNLLYVVNNEVDCYIVTYYVTVTSNRLPE